MVPRFFFPNRARSAAAVGVIRAGVALDRSFRRALAMEQERRSADRGGSQTTAAMSRLLSDVRHSLRALRRAPLYTISAAGTLALAIGAGTLVFTFANAVFIRPMPFPNDHELVGISATHRAANGEVLDFAPSSVDYFALRQRTRSFTDVGAIDSRSYALRGPDRPETILGATVTATMWTVLGTPPLAGRYFDESEDAPGSSVVVISRSLQERLFPGAPDGALGRSIDIDGTPRTVIGVMPRTFRPRLNPGDVWMPMGLTAAGATTARQYQLVARLQRGVTLEAARRDADRVMAQLAEERAATHKEWGASVKDLRAKIGDSARTVTLVLSAAVAFLLLLACANVTNLALVRVARRRQEISTRMALGASTFAIARQQVVESVLVGLGGGVLGVAFALLLLPPAQLLMTSSNPLVSAVEVDWRVFVAALFMTVTASALCAAAPIVFGLRLARSGIGSTARRYSWSRRDRALRRTLMTAQIAAAALLLVSASSALQSLRDLAAAPVGFTGEDRVIATMTMPASRYANTPARSLLVESILDGLRSTTGVDAASLSSNRFVRGQSTQAMVKVDGVEMDLLATEVRRIDREYFDAMNLALIAGRAFEATDRDSAPAVIIVNQAFARRFLPGQSPIGARIKRGNNPPATIVGLVPDVMDLGVGVDVGPTLYLPYTQFANTAVALVVRSRLPINQVEALIRKSVQSVDPDQPVQHVTALQQLLDESMGEPRFKSLLLAALSALALLVAAIGIYGVTAYIISERTREVAIRIALGARPRAVLQALLFESVRWISLGIGAGLVAAALVASGTAVMLPELSSAGWPTFAFTAVLILLLGVLATTLPSLRALRVQPAIVLRGE